MEALYLIPTLLATFLVYQERKLREEAEKAWRLERVGLLNRIQAPELLPTLVAEDPADFPLYVPEGDFAAHDEYVERRAAGEVT